MRLGKEETREGSSNRLTNSTFVLLDAGEGTFGQLYRVYGRELGAMLQQISVAFISHLHADHHLGLVRVLIERAAAAAMAGNKALQPLVIVAPKPFEDWLLAFSAFVEPLCFSFIDCATLEAGSPLPCVEARGLLTMKTVSVIHCPLSYGVVLAHESGWKIVYVTHTRIYVLRVPHLTDKSTRLVIHDAHLRLARGALLVTIPSGIPGTLARPRTLPRPVSALTS